MKVLHLYSGNLYGGIERLLATLAGMRHLAPEMEPAFGLCFRGRLWDELSAAGVPIHDLGQVRVSRPWTVWRARRRLANGLSSQVFDAVVCHACWPHAVFAPVVRRAGVRLVAFVHDILTGTGWVERWAARTPPDLAIANSRHTAGTVPAVFPGVPVEVAYLPVPEPELGERGIIRREVRNELGTPSDAVVVLQASRLERWKGQAVNVEALGLLRDTPGWEAWFAGGPQKAGEQTYLDELQAQVKELGIANRVRFIGQRSNIPRLMAAADIYCQPNTGPEPFGVVLVEALYAGLPVVTSDLGGAAEIVNESCGIRVSPNETHAVARALKLLIEEPMTRIALGQSGPIRAADLCNPARQIGRLAELLAPRTRVIA